MPGHALSIGKLGGEAEADVLGHTVLGGNFNLAEPSQPIEHALDQAEEHWLSLADEAESLRMEI